MPKKTQTPQSPTENQQISPREADGGPLARQRAFLAERFGGSLNRGEATRSLAPAADAPTDSTVADLRLQQLAAFRQRQQQQGAREEAFAAPGPVAAGTRGTATPDFAQANRWIAIGPTVVRQGQSGKQPAMSGRARGIAVAPGGQRVYVATANGGVWRSEDSGRTWLSLMDAFDLNPTMFRADSLACGAIALAPGNWAGQDTLYVGSGEPGVGPFFQGDSAYFGVGPIVSIDGGLNWLTESSQPSLAGSAFYALAVDPLHPQRVIAATYKGLYRREPDGQNGFVWKQKHDGVFCSVVVTHRAGTTTFFAAQWGGSTVFQSSDGEAWTTLGTDFPTSDVERIGLAVQVDNPDVLYALVCKGNGHLHGVYRFEARDGKWRTVRDVPATLFGPNLTNWGQGSYDLAIAVDPADVNRIYLGGSIVHSDGIRPHPFIGDWSGSLYRCEIEIQPTTKTVRAKPTYIGGSIHGDLHTLVFAPSDPNKLWVGCDGGVFYSTKPTVNPTAPEHADGLFSARNTGLATLTMNHLGQHPTEEAVVFCGTQDNGGLRYTGEPAWLYSSGGDSGSFVVNWRDPYLVLSTYTSAHINRSLNGGMRYSYDSVAGEAALAESAEFYAPIAGTPYQPTDLPSADRVAFGGGRVWISDSFGGEPTSGADWRSIPTGEFDGDLLNTNVKSLRFATANKLYAGTMFGGVYRFDCEANAWSRTALHPIQNSTSSAIDAPITSIAVDPADPSGNSIYITLGGLDNPHRVWHYDGAHWEPRSGPQEPAGVHPQALLNVQHNAIVADLLNTEHLYAAADIGVWRSTDAGQTWEVFSQGLPDAAVVDLELHAAGRLLRAATHGRGVYEFDLGRLQNSVELFVRDNQLDLGRRPAALGLPDPVLFGTQVGEGNSPDIKVDALNAQGQYQFPAGSTLDFFEFVDRLQDQSTVWTHATASIKTRVYVQVHNHGKITANNVRVLLLLCKANETLPALPAGYDTNVRNGMPIENDAWQTVGVTMVHGIRPGYPQIAMFEFNSDLLPLPSQLAGDANKFSLVALVHNSEDPFIADAATEIRPRINRKAARKQILVAAFTGQLPQPVTLRKGANGSEPPAFLAEHRVRRGDTLFIIAKRYYNAGNQWPLIYRANQTLIGANPNVLRVGTILKIPKLEP